MKKKSLIVTASISLFVGFLLGAAAIHRPISLTPLELPPPRAPWNPQDIMGLIGSVGIRTLQGHLGKLPFVVSETDKTLVLSVSFSKTKVHYVIVPKKDIRDISQLSAEDEPYLKDLFATTGHLIEKDGLKDYVIFTNGHAQQKVSYLHFHLVGKKASHQ